MKKDLKETEIWKFFKEYFIILQDYYVPEKDSKYWDNLVAHGSKMVEKYKDTDFGRYVNDMVQAELRFLERKSTGKNQKYDIGEIAAEKERQEKYLIRTFLEKHEGKTVREALDEL